jgi:hypothetical protein
MRRLVSTAAVATLAGTIGLAVPLAQQTTEIHPGRGGSPHVRTEWTIDGASLAIEYGRPSLKGRPEAELMPAGEPWRTGADEATTITSDRALTFGALTLPPGTYTINTRPGPSGWQLIFGRVGKPGQWGVPYQPALEIGRALMMMATLPTAVELLTISIDDTPAGATLYIEWGRTRASIDFTVS